MSKAEYKLAVRTALLEYARKSAATLVQDVTYKSNQQPPPATTKKRKKKSANPLQLAFSFDDEK